MRFILLIFILVSCDSKKEPITTMKVDAAFDSLQKAADSFNMKLLEIDTLASSVYRETHNKIKEYQTLIKKYESQEADIIVKKVVDSSALKLLRAKLSDANKEIIRLNQVVANQRSNKYTDRYERPDNYSAVKPDYIETPDENSIVINLDGNSKEGNLPIENLVIYLIPYNRKVRQHMRFETSCDERLYGNLRAQYYNGQYFFNEIKPGKYLIKICTYYGNYRLIDKGAGKYNISMQIAPPIQ